MLRRFRPAAAAALLTGLLVACPGRAPDASRGASPSPTPEGRRGGTLRVLLSEDVDALDPQRAGQPASWGLLRGMHRGLMAFPASAAPDGSTPVPDLAEAAPEVSPDGLRYTFRLRGGIAFGAPESRPIRAGDVKAGLERVQAAGSPVARYFTPIGGVAVPDDRTVVISLSRPVNDLLWLLALPAASAVPPGLAAIVPPGRIPSSGPYRLADEGGYVAERRIRLVRNDAWDSDSDPVRAAWVDEIAVEIGVDPAEASRRILAGKADLSGDAPAGVDEAAVPATRIARAPNGCIRYLFLNTRVAPFNSQRVRTAVAAAVDRAAIAAHEGSGAAPATTILAPTITGHNPSLAAPGADPAGARRVLAAAGFPRGFATRLVTGDRAADRAEAQAIRAALARAGIRVTVRTLPIASVYEDAFEIPAAKIPMGLATWCADWPGMGGRGALSPLVDGRTIAARANTNLSGLSNRTLNGLLDAAAAERDPRTAAERWRVADAVAFRLAAVVPLTFGSDTSLLGPDVRGFVGHPYFVRGDPTAVWLDRE